MKTLQFPLSKITGCFVAGIIFAFYLKPKIEIAFASLLICFALFVFSYFLSKKDFIPRFHFGLTAFFLSFLIGLTTQAISTGYSKKDNYIHRCSDPDKIHLVEIMLKEKLKSSVYNNRYVAEVRHLDNRKCSGKILLNVEKNSSMTDFEIGSRLLIRERIFRHTLPYNPDQFNYGNYLTNKSILAQVYTGVSNIRVNPEPEKNIWYYAAKFRNRIIYNLKNSNFSNEELQVVIALILGQQQEISEEILHDYQFAGAVHVLSVSGLHIGFILLFINFLLSKLPNTRAGNLMRFFISLLSLWCFAIIAGLSPSVVRSVTMFSFVAFGMYLKRETNIFHTLLVSVLLILLVAPSFLFDVGFQLSYVSLFFILWLQPMLSGFFIAKNKVVSYFWDILTVSFAAQIGAMPLGIYYFHQFPGLFFITNLIILPGLGVIMGIGVIVMAMAAFNYVPEIPAKILEWLIYLLNSSIKQIASYEQFIIRDIPLNTFMLVTFYLMIAGLVIWFKKKSFNSLVFALLMIISFQLAFLGTTWKNQSHKEWFVFHSKKNSVILKRIGENITVYSNDSILKSIEKNKAVNSYLVANFCKITKLEKLGNTGFFNNNKILILDSTGIYPKRGNPDIIVITQSPKINLSRLLDDLNPKAIVADGSNYKTYVERWKKTCHNRKIPFHATAEKGFYKIE